MLDDYTVMVKVYFDLEEGDGCGACCYAITYLANSLVEANRLIKAMFSHPDYRSHTTDFKNCGKSLDEIYSQLKEVAEFKK